MKAEIIPMHYEGDEEVAAYTFDAIKLTPENDTERKVLVDISTGQIAFDEDSYYRASFEHKGPGKWTHVVLKPSCLTRIIFDGYPNVELYTPNKPMTLRKLG